MNLEILISFSLASAALAISPGPDNIFVLVQSLAKGSRSGLAVVCGLISGCIIHTTLVAFGAAAIIKTNPTVFMVLKTLGASYLMYLAFNVYRSSGKIDLDPGQAKSGDFWKLFKTGFIMNVVNPKVSIFFLAFFPGFLFSEEISTIFQFYILGLIFMLVSFVIFASIALGAGLISDYTRSHPNVGQLFKWLQIIVFVAIATFILIS